MFSTLSAIIVCTSKEYFELRWATLRCFVEPAVADKIVIPHLEYLNRAKLVVGKITGATKHEVTVEEQQVDGVLSIPYDFLIIATGSQPEPAIPFQDRLKYYKQRKNDASVSCGISSGFISRGPEEWRRWAQEQLEGKGGRWLVLLSTTKARLLASRAQQ